MRHFNKILFLTAECKTIAAIDGARIWRQKQGLQKMGSLF